MKLLFDQNLSPRLPARLADLYPGSAHVDDIGLATAGDDIVWDYAEANGFAVVTRDEDYSQMSVLRGCPPKVVWIVVGNCKTARIEGLLRSRHADLIAFDADPDAGVIELS